MSKAKASLCVITATFIAVVALFFAPKPAAPILQTATITRGELEITAMLQGTVAYSDTRYLPAPVAGKVQRVFKQPGDSLAAGEMVVELEHGAELSALSALEHRQFSLAVGLETLPTVGTALGDVAGELLQWGTNRSQLLASIAAKQIRAEGSGTLSNLYVQPGDYVQAGAPLAQIRGDTLCITAVWTADQSRLPAPGMAAAWCSDDGTPRGMLQLVSVSMPELGEHAGLRLCFEPTAGESVPLQAGTVLPVRLVLDTLPPAGLVPLAALDSKSRLWILRDGRAVPEAVTLGDSADGLVQVPAELAGLRAVLEPDETVLREKHTVKVAEVP